MGYETTLFVVIEERTVPLEDKCWADVIGMIDLNKMSLNAFRNEAEGYFFSLDGNTVVKVDRYEEPLKSADIEDVINELDEVIATSPVCFSAIVARDMLKSVQREVHGTSARRIKVYQFGH